MSCRLEEQIETLRADVTEIKSDIVDIKKMMTLVLEKLNNNNNENSNSSSSASSEQQPVGPQPPISAGNAAASSSSHDQQNQQQQVITATKFESIPPTSSVVTDPHQRQRIWSLAGPQGVPLSDDVIIHAPMFVPSQHLNANEEIKSMHRTNLCTLFLADETVKTIGKIRVKDGPDSHQIWYGDVESPLREGTHFFGFDFTIIEANPTGNKEPPFLGVCTPNATRHRELPGIQGETENKATGALLTCNNGGVFCGPREGPGLAHRGCVGCLGNFYGSSGPAQGLHRIGCLWIDGGKNIIFYKDTQPGNAAVKFRFPKIGKDQLGYVPCVVITGENVSVSTIA